MCTCLYLRNLPRRPRSRDHYVRHLLKCINFSNPYALDYELPLPRNETIGNGELKMLDEPNGILDISVSKSLISQCFITFIDESAAQAFQKRGLKVKGHQIDIKAARRDSLLGLSIKNPGLLQRILTSRRQRKLYGDELMASKRRSRRLRSKLRKKGLNETEIANQLNVKISKPKKEATMKTQYIRNSPENVKVVTNKNPPNKVLLVQGLPDNCQLSEIQPIFQNDGFVEIRLVAIRKVAFVEYDSVPNAMTQLNSLGERYKFKDCTISIGFAK